MYCKMKANPLVIDPLLVPLPFRAIVIKKNIFLILYFLITKTGKTGNISEIRGFTRGRKIENNFDFLS